LPTPYSTFTHFKRPWYTQATELSIIEARIRVATTHEKRQELLHFIRQTEQQARSLEEQLETKRDELRLLRLHLAEVDDEWRGGGEDPPRAESMDLAEDEEEDRGGLASGYRPANRARGGGDRPGELEVEMEALVQDLKVGWSELKSGFQTVLESEP
jgi:hypothetical protein